MFVDTARRLVKPHVEGQKEENMIKNRFVNTLPCKIFNSVTLIIVKSMWYITFVSYNDSLNFSDYSIPGRKLLLFGQLGSEPTRCRIFFLRCTSCTLK